MHILDLSSYPRKPHFDLFRGMDYPHFSLCAPVDVTQLHAAMKDRGQSFTIALIFVLSRVANALPEFRQRIRGEAIVEHEVVHPAPTLPTEDGLFGFYYVDFADDYTQFSARADAAIRHASAHPSLADEPGRDDWIFPSAVPWVAFTSITHPIHMHPPDSIPRLSWGKFTRARRRISMPLSVQVNHALMDGLHVGRYYQQLQAALDDLDWLA